MDLVETLTQFAGRVAESKGLELVDAEIFRAGRRRIVRIYIGKRGGVSIEDCALVSRELSVLLDAGKFLENEAYTLEVSSPGLDRPFKTMRDYHRNVGRHVRIATREPLEGRRLFVGRLEEVRDDGVLLDLEGRKVSVPLDLVAQAKVDVRIG